jgi:hypothetical protein
MGMGIVLVARHTTEDLTMNLAELALIILMSIWAGVALVAIVSKFMTLKRKLMQRGNL